MNDIERIAEEINRYIAQREKLDPAAVYAQLKDLYPLVLTTASALEEREFDPGWDFKILCGESLAGRFELYDNGLDIIFDVYKADGTNTHWHPADTAEAIGDIHLFMQGICKG